MSNNFSEITCVESLQRECESLLAQVKMHQRQIESMRQDMKHIHSECLNEALEELFFTINPYTGARTKIASQVSYEDLCEYVVSKIEEEL